MKYLKKYNYLISENLLNPIEDYVLPFVDLGFEVKLSSENIGDIRLNLESDKLTDEIRFGIFHEYLAMIDRLKLKWTITSHNIIFSGDTNVSIFVRRKIKDLEEEVQMTDPQKRAYDSVVASLKEGQKLKIHQFYYNYITFHKWLGDSTSLYSWVTIYDDGRISLPTLSGPKSQRRTELPFTEQDIKWFKRILSVDIYPEKNIEESQLLHSESQENLRKIYK